MYKIAAVVSSVLSLLRPNITQKTNVHVARPSVEDIKYPAAVVFEGGKGHLQFVDESEYSPLWRIYICFEKTDQPIQEQVDLDFTQLEDPITTRTYIASLQHILLIQKLNGVKLNYTYTAKIEQLKGADGFSLGSGQVELKMKSQQVWETFFKDPSYEFDGRYNNLSLFDRVISPGSLIASKWNNAYLNGNKFYLASYLVRFAFHEKENTFSPIDVCERENKPYVLEVLK